MFIGLLALFAIVIVGTASAFDLSSLLGGDSSGEAQEITIEGINFTIPEGYSSDPTSVFENVTTKTGSVSYTMNGQTFKNDAGDEIAILVADYGDLNVTDDILKQVSDSKKTIKDYNGYVKKDGKYTVFSYIEEGDLVTVTVSDESVLEKVLV